VIRTSLLTLLLLLSGCDNPYGLKEISYDIRADIRYATKNNFTGHKLYWEGRCFLREATALKLAAADAELRASGLAIKVYDCYRPLSVQRLMWSIVPDARYVADPETGSRHNRGAAVDVTLVELADGIELWMPTIFDDFSERSHRNYTNLPPEPIANRNRLADVMTRNGFIGLPTEWWHFDDSEWQKYDVLDVNLRDLKTAPGKSGRNF
jgi:zinc D-Ala-D-Ala dipeptidase